jgi:hypothetical protein
VNVEELRRREQAELRAARAEVEADPLFRPLVEAAVNRYGMERGEAEDTVRTYLRSDRRCR